MRESIGGAWILGLIISFILLFTAFLAVTINYTKAFRVKNEVINFIEREEGFTSRTGDDDGALQLINNYLNQSNHKATGRCEEGWLGVSSYDANTSPEKVVSNKRYYYCVQKFDTYDSNEKYKATYNVVVFYEFNLPIFGDIFTFAVNGQTTQIYYPGDCKTWGKC